VTARSLFGQYAEGDPKVGFLIMPFDRDLTWIRDAVVAAGVEEGFKIERGDDICRPGVVLDQIFTAIDAAHVVVAVCTGKDPNVFFELGYASRKHSPILIAESDDNLPFDIRHFRTVLYGGRSANQEALTLLTQVRRTLRAAYDLNDSSRASRVPGR
jgi:hypothetical protein